MTSETQLPVIPVGYRLLIEPVKAEEKSAGGIIFAHETKDAHDAFSYIGKVVGMGSDCYQHPKFKEISWCKVGDYIAHGRYAGQKFVIKGKGGGDDITYRLLNDDEVLGVVPDPGIVKIYV